MFTMKLVALVFLLIIKFDCFHGQHVCKPDSSEEVLRLTIEEDRVFTNFNPNDFYRFTVQSQGDRRSIDIINDGQNNKLTLARTSHVSSQRWKLRSLGNNYYRLTTEWQGDDKSLDVVNDGILDHKLSLAPTGQYSGQMWKITPVGNGFYRLTTQWKGYKRSLSFFSNSVVLANTKCSDEQFWKITRA